MPFTRIRIAVEELASAAPLANPERTRPRGRRKPVHGTPRLDLKVFTLIGCLVILIATVIMIGVTSHHRGGNQPSATASTTTSSVPPTGAIPVPNVVGLKTSQAAGASQAAGLTNSIDDLSCNGAVASGVVVSQSPQAGFHAASGSRISLQVSCSGSTTPTLVTPQGMTLGPDGLGIVTVGDSQASVVAGMTQALGAPTATGGGGCQGQDRGPLGRLVVGVLLGDSGLLPVPEWLTDTVGLEGTNSALNTPLLRTDAGATLGMTLGQVQLLYPPDDFTMEHGGSIVVAGSKAGDLLLLEFDASSTSTPLWEIKGGAPCGDF